MAEKKDNQQITQNVNWGLILKIAIAVLTAIAGAIGVSKSDSVTDLVNGIYGKE